MVHKAKTFCRNCGALCSMEVTVEGGRLLNAVADAMVPFGPLPDDLPMTPTKLHKLMQNAPAA